MVMITGGKGLCVGDFVVFALGTRGCDPLEVGEAVISESLGTAVETCT